MIDFKKLVATADHHIKRGDLIMMDPKVVRKLAVMLIARDERIREEIAGMTRINQHFAISKSGDPIFTSPAEGNDLLDDGIPECKWCGGSGIEGATKVES